MEGARERRGYAGTRSTLTLTLSPCRERGSNAPPHAPPPRALPAQPGFPPVRE